VELPFPVPHSCPFVEFASHHAKFWFDLVRLGLTNPCRSPRQACRGSPFTAYRPRHPPGHPSLHRPSGRPSIAIHFSKNKKIYPPLSSFIVQYPPPRAGFLPTSEFQRPVPLS